MRLRLSLCLCLLANLGAADPQDCWQYLGPQRTGVYTGCGWKTPLPTSAPTPIWQVKVGTGYGMPVATKDHVYVPILDPQKEEALTCLDAATGATIWTTSLGKGWTNKQYPGPRGTPLLKDGRLYFITSYATVACLDAKTGAKIWSQDLTHQQPTWGLSGSLLLHQGNLYILTGGKGGSLVTIDAATGKTNCQVGRDEPAYGSAMTMNLEGKTSILFVTKAGATLNAPEDCKVLAQVPWSTMYGVNLSAIPLPDNRVLMSSGYKSGTAMFTITGGKTTQTWKTNDLASHINTPIVDQGRIYGVTGQAGGDGTLVCLDLADGKTLWQGTAIKGFGSGHLAKADDQILAVGNDGLAVIFAPEATYRELARFRLLAGRTWTPPALVGSKVLLRNDTTLACYDLGR